MADELSRHANEEDQSQQLRELAIVEERERIARELHDGFAQVLGYINAKVMAVRLLVQKQKLPGSRPSIGTSGENSQGLICGCSRGDFGIKNGR